jgi:hypothetical protein
LCQKVQDFGLAGDLVEFGALFWVSLLDFGNLVFDDVERDSDEVLDFQIPLALGLVERT